MLGKDRIIIFPVKNIWDIFLTNQGIDIGDMTVDDGFTTEHSTIAFIARALGISYIRELGM